MTLKTLSKLYKNFSLGAFLQTRKRPLPLEEKPMERTMLLKPALEPIGDLTPLFVRDFNLCIIRFTEVMGLTRVRDQLLVAAKRKVIEAGYALEALDDYVGRRPKTFDSTKMLDDLTVCEIGAILEHLSKKSDHLRYLRRRLLQLNAKTQRDTFRLLLNEVVAEFSPINALASVIGVKHNSLGRWLTGESAPHAVRREELRDQLVQVLEVTIAMIESQFLVLTSLANEAGRSIDEFIAANQNPAPTNLSLVPIS